VEARAGSCCCSGIPAGLTTTVDQDLGSEFMFQGSGSRREGAGFRARPPLELQGFPEPPSACLSILRVSAWCLGLGAWSSRRRVEIEEEGQLWWRVLDPVVVHVYPPD
jgi:hypothetical protein